MTSTDRFPSGSPSACFLILAAVAALTVWNCGVSRAGEDRESSAMQGKVLRAEERFERTWTEGFIRVLDIRPGMTILDIGTGTGRYARAFAEMMEGTGMVYATDIVPDLVRYLSGEAERRSLGNLAPVLVTREGVDEFYGRHAYDLITLFHVVVIHLGKVEYFREMRSFLTDNGRLVVTYQVKFPPFTPDDVTDFDGLVESLLSEPAGSPFSSVFSGETRDLIEGQPKGAAIDEQVRNAVIEDLNGTVEDVRFGGAFADGLAVREGPGFTPEEKDFADWLLLYVKSKGGYDGAELSTGDRNKAATLNRLLLARQFRPYLSPAVAAPYGHRAQGEAIIAKLEEAGYRLHGIYDDLVPFEITIVFTAGEP